MLQLSPFAQQFAWKSWMPRVICFWQWGSRDSIRIPLYFPAILPPWYPQVGQSHSAPGDVGDHWHPLPVWSRTQSDSGRGTPSLVWWPQHQSCSLSRNPTNRRIHHAHRNYLPWWLPWYWKKKFVSNLKTFTGLCIKKCNEKLVHTIQFILTWIWTI